MHKFTHGGLPASQAVHWNTETYLRLGDIVFKLLTGDIERRRKAVCNYWELKRHFMKEEFEEYIALLDAYRVNKKTVPFSDMITAASREFSFNDPYLHADLDAKNEPVPEKYYLKWIFEPVLIKTLSETVEQLSLF